MGEGFWGGRYCIGERREILCGGGASGDSVRVRNVGNDSPSGEGFRGFPTRGSKADGGHAHQTAMGREMGVTNP